MTWSGPADVKRQLESYWDQGRFLAARVTGSSVFPLTLRLRRPDTRALSDQFDEVRNWIRTLEDGSKGRRGFGYEIEWEDVNHRQLGRNRVPAGVVVPSEADALKVLGKVQPAQLFQNLADATLQAFPELREWLAKKPLIALEHAEEWDRFLDILGWFRRHPRPAVYLRQVDVPRVHTKFIEGRRGILSELLDVVLPADATNNAFSGAKNFEQRYGMLAKPSLVRFRILDSFLYIAGLSDITVPADEFARLRPAADRVFITENELNGLAFPQVHRGLVIFGLGYSLERLADAAWLHETDICYWGDIDTHGFAILDRLRYRFPNARSLLMDRDTLIAHRELWVKEEARHNGHVTRLTPSENALYDELRSDHLGSAVRLEQERISYGFLNRALSSLND